jgi:hypothetical protein
MPTKKPKSIHQLKVTLLETEPAIWRRFQVQSDVTLHKLATVINAAMGWEGYHIHEFIIGKDVWGPELNIDDDFGEGPKNDQDTTLEKVAPRTRCTFKYQYDGGDCWMHKVVVEGVLEPVPKQRYPVCLDGGRACPPEDCGGIPGYANFLDAISDRSHPDHENLLEWIGGKFDPEAFDVAKVNQRLRALR